MLFQFLSSFILILQLIEGVPLNSTNHTISHSKSDILGQQLNNIDIISGSIHDDFDDFHINDDPKKNNSEDNMYRESYIPPTTQEEKEFIEHFDPSKLNYTQLRIEIDNWIDNTTSRDARFYSFSYGFSSLPKYLTSITNYLDLEQVVYEIETSFMSATSCTACKMGVQLVQSYIESGKTTPEMIRDATQLCKLDYVHTPRVCIGIVHLMAEEILYVIRKLDMTPDEICGFVIGDICGVPFSKEHQWRVAFPPIPKPSVQQPTLPIEGAPTLKVLHLSDTHYDPDYEAGTNNNCGDPLCCRRTSGKPKSRKDRAGYWGDYGKCDTPRRLIESMNENIAYLHPDIDYIIWTGDLPPHDVWNQTKEGNLHVIRETVKQLLDYFPYTPIFPALGNHESSPVNSFAPPYVAGDYGVEYLYNELDRHWQKWLPQDTSNTVRKGGFYSVLVRPNFRIISMNMNYCNNKNWWLLLNSTDPGQELQWLIYELQGAELRGEKVHIIGHIPPGHPDCLKVWSHNYYTIINRYESTITAQFFGHTHFDEYQLFYDEYQRHRVTNIAYIGPSVGSYYSLNPGYRIYTIEGDYEGSRKMVTDHETWVMNLDEANRLGSRGYPRWYQMYSAKRAYNMESLLPQEWDRLIYRMMLDDDLFKKYHRFYWKNSPVREECNAECKKRMLCDLKSGRSNDRKKTCANIKENITAQERSDWTNWLFSGITVTSFMVAVPVAAVVIPKLLLLFLV